MTERRDVLLTLMSAWGTAWLGRSSHAHTAGVHVEATASIFYHQPDGATNLVRFTVTGADQPAGRLRVFDRHGHLLGTAGVLRAGGEMVGELWIPLAGPTHLRTELEMPGTRRPITSYHRVTPGPRWTLHWITIADPNAVEMRMARTAPILRASLGAALGAAGVGLNPLPARWERDSRDHLGLLRLAVPAARDAMHYDVPLSGVAFASQAPTLPTLAMALAGSGVQLLAYPGNGEAVSRLTAPDGSAVLVAEVPRDADPERLGFGAPFHVMAPRIEAWLEGRAAGMGGGNDALVVGADLERAAAARGAIASWNAAYAFPRIIVGDPAELAKAIRARTLISPSAEPTGEAASVPPVDVLQGMVTAERADRDERFAKTFAPLAAALRLGQVSLERIAESLSLPIAGAVVFNASPFTATGIVQMPDGSEELATDIPGSGYAFVVPRENVPKPRDEAPGTTIETAQFRAALDPATGAIASLLTVGTGHEWAGAGGLGAIEGTTLVSSGVRAVSGIGARLIARRQGPAGSIQTTLTLYDASPWADLTLQAPPNTILPLRFALGLGADRVEREIPGGRATASLPAGPLPQLRWLTLLDDSGGVTVGTTAVPYVDVDADGTFTCYAAPGARVRLAPNALGTDEPWRVGWSMEPLRAVPAGGRGAAALPTFGRLFSIDQPGVVLTGLAPSGSAGVIAYLQELLGVARSVKLGAGVLRFRHAVLTDFTGRVSGAAPPTDAGSITVPVPAFGFAAVRLSGFEVAPG